MPQAAMQRAMDMAATEQGRAGEEEMAPEQAELFYGLRCELPEVPQVQMGATTHAQLQPQGVCGQAGDGGGDQAVYTTTKLVDTRWPQPRNTLVCLSCAQYFTLRVNL